MKKRNKDREPDINEMLDQLAQMTEKVNKYIQGNGNSKKLKKKSQKVCNSVTKSKEI